LPTVQIRRLEDAEVPGGLLELSRAFFQEYEGHHEVFSLGELGDEDIISYFSRFVAGEDHAAYIAVRGGDIVGYITVRIQDQPGYWKTRRLGHISGLMVRRDRRREGIGTRLLEEARAFFRTQAVKHYTVYTAVGNQAGAEFYRRHGRETLHTHVIGIL
jgi:ribosomal protein S18 acetylase RimI-like enzyme